MRINKQQYEVYEIVNSSKMQVAFLGKESIKAFYMKIEGKAANIPSVGNNRVLSTNTSEIKKCIYSLLKHPKHTRYLATQALKHIENIKPSMRKHGGHCARLKALTVLYRQEVIKPVRLPCTKEIPWSFHCYVSSFSNRTDSHNIPKALCDWMEEIGLIDNDLYIDLACYRKKNFNDSDVDSLEIIGIPYNFSKDKICTMKNELMEFAIQLSQS
jgi:hypothetical protein